MEKTTLYLPSDLHRALREIARRTGRPQAALMRDALQVYVGQFERPRLRSLGLGDNAELSAEDTEDWLSQHWHPV